MLWLNGVRSVTLERSTDSPTAFRTGLLIAGSRCLLLPMKLAVIGQHAPGPPLSILRRDQPTKA